MQVCGLTGRDLTYKQVRLLCKRLATSLLKEGFKPGDVIAMILPNMPDFPIVALGLMEAGLTLTTLNHAYTTSKYHFHSICNFKIDFLVNVSYTLFYNQF